VGEDASVYWGTTPAAAALAIWSRTSRVAQYPETYNVPLHLLEERPDLSERARHPVHVHYHSLFGEPHHRRALERLRGLDAGDDRLEWLAARLPLRPAPPRV
jgi:hypothetical protein